MRAVWLESHDEFEGIGAHELNPRYDHVDDVASEFDAPDTGLDVGPVDTPALARAQSFIAVDTPTGRLDGADTSHYQAERVPFNLLAARQAGLSWWAHKVSQSTGYIDPTWHGTSMSMQLPGFEFMLGYHWLSSTTDPVQQATWTLRCMGDMARIMSVMGDCEEQGLTVDRCVAFYECIEAFTHKPCSHYTGAYVGGGAIFSYPRIRQSKYGIRPVILAAYTSRSRMMTLPNVAAMGYQAWQYSSNGPVPGMTGRCDMDEVADRNAFALSMHGYIPAPPIEVVPPVVPAVPIVLPTLDVSTMGGHMYSIVSNSDAAPDSDDAKIRWAWNGIVKVHLTWDKFCDFAHGGLLLAGHDDLANPLAMNTATLDGYQTL